MTTGWNALLAAGEESKTGSIGPGLTAFIVVLLLVIATAFLMRSMLKQIKKVPPTFDAPDTSADPSDTGIDPSDGGDGPSRGSPDAEADDPR